MRISATFLLCACAGTLTLLALPVHSQMIDNTQATNPINAGINKSLTQEIGASRGLLGNSGTQFLSFTFAQRA